MTPGWDTPSLFNLKKTGETEPEHLDRIRRFWMTHPSLARSRLKALLLLQPLGMVEGYRYSLN